MIFNPLFIGENGSTQSLIPKSGKLANNKYLFSDIVKVVMSPATTGNRKSSLRLDGVNNNLKLGLDSEQKLVQLKYRLLTDEHSEQVKSELADILPADIAQLLINEESVAINERAISYISKETLKGELQNFLHDLIGAEIIEQNISQKSGLLLNLEDKKSAINIELVENSSGKSKSDKIIVQTLVVPEKSRLLSILGNGNNNEILFRTSKNSADQLFTSSSELKLTNGQSEIIKPTLSVYSFSRDGNQFESLTKNIRSNETFKSNLDLLKNNSENSNLTAAKSHLEKISFIPSEFKNRTVNADDLKTNISASKANADLKLVKNHEVKKESDYSVSKITIVKKQDEGSLLNSIKSKVELSPNEFESALRRIDFNKNIESQKAGLHLIKNTQNPSAYIDKIKPENLTAKIDKNVDINLSERTSSKGIVKEADLKLATNKANKLELKTDVSKETDKTVSKADVETDKTSDSKIKETKLEVKVESVKPNIKELQFEKLNANLKTATTENKIQTIKVDGSVNNKSVSVDQSVYESKPNSDSKTELKNNTADQEKNLTADQAKKTQEKDNSHVQKENQEVKAASQNIVNQNFENTEAKDNSKFSVKVKGGIKSVSDKNESIQNSIEDKPSNSNASNSEGGKSENNESKQTQNSSLPNNQFEMKQHAETNFQHTLNKSEIGQLNFGDNKTTFVEPKVSPQIIKSVEVIKEISEFISKQTKGSLSFDIRPEHLGKMKITLDTVDKMLKANIEVETEQAKHLVEKNIDKLQQQLSNNGLQLNSLNISLSYSKQQRDGKKLNNKTENESESLGQVGEAEEEKGKKQLGYNTYEYIA